MSRTSDPDISAELFRLLVAGVEHYAIFMLDAHGRVVSWNRGGERIKGYTKEEIVGQHYSVFYPEEAVAAGKPDRLLELAAREGRAEDEGWRVRRDGSLIWAHVVITAVRDDSGALVGFAKVTRDLSDDRAAAEALRRSEERLRLLVESISDYAIYMLDPGGIVTTWNAGAERIKGYTPAEIIGRSYSAFFVPEDIAAGRPETELMIALASGRYEEEGWRVRKDGQRFWAGVVITAVHDAAGGHIGFAKVTRDLSARQQAETTARELAVERAAREAAETAETALREERERYRALSRRLEAILEGIADGVTVQDRTGRLLFANTSAAETCGFSSVPELLAASTETIGSRFRMLDEAGAPFDTRRLPGRRVLDGEKTAHATIRVRELHSGREWWSAIRASLVIDEAGGPDLAVNVWHDVSEDRRREERERYLASATAGLSSSLDYESMLQSLAGVLVPGLADWCSIHLLDGDELRNVAVTHVDPDRIAQAREFAIKYPPDPAQARGVWQVLRTGIPELLEEIPDALIVAGAKDAEHLKMLREVGMRSVVIVPIRIREQVCGTITLVSAESDRNFQRADVVLAEELGRRAGIAVENTRLYSAERAARERLQLIARAGETFLSTLEYEATLRSVVAIVLPALGDFAFFDIVEGTNVRRIAAAHEDPATDAIVGASTWVRSTRKDLNLCALSSGETGVHIRIDDAFRRDIATSAEHLESLRRLDLCSMITVPVRDHESVFASLTVCFGKSGRHYTSEDVGLVEELARRAGVAIVQSRLFAEARSAAKAAEEASRLKDNFLATVSHELRTPLNAIVGWSSLLREKNDDPGLSKGLDVIHRNAHAQSKIIDDILDVSRIVTGKLRLDLERTDLARVIEEAIEVVRPSANAKNITIGFQAAGPLLILADPARLQQVVWNLLSNAVKFTSAGGSIAVVVAQESSALVLTVTDTGAGIDAEFLPFVFDRFHQADGTTTRRVGGLGLGLAIVRHLTELHGGHVTAASAGLGTGSAFTVRLPLGMSAPADPAEERSAKVDQRSIVSNVTLEGVTVLVVEDEDDARDLVKALLESAGARVDTASSVAAALAIFPRSRPDVIVSDIGMPGEDGYELVRLLRALPPGSGGDAPALALTAYARREDAEKALAAGFTAHLSKPFDPNTLLAKVRTMASPKTGS